MRPKYWQLDDVGKTWYSCRISLPPHQSDRRGARVYEGDVGKEQGRSLYLRYEHEMCAGKESLRAVEAGLAARLTAWQRRTRDAWRCAPAAVLEPVLPTAAAEHGDHVCRSLDNGLLLYRPH
jgi:hypothetical protein